MFFNLEKPVVITLIAIIAAQYAFATFCLMKLATLDLPRKNYVLWNVFILLVFFIGGIVFLVYYFKVKDAKTVQPFVPPMTDETDGEETAASEDGVTETAEAPEVNEANDNAADNAEPNTPDDSDGNGNAENADGVN